MYSIIMFGFFDAGFSIAAHEEATKFTGKLVAVTQNPDGIKKIGEFSKLAKSFYTLSLKEEKRLDRISQKINKVNLTDFANDEKKFDQLVKKLKSLATEKQQDDLGWHLVKRENYLEGLWEEVRDNCVPPEHKNSPLVFKPEWEIWLAPEGHEVTLPFYEPDPGGF